MEYKDTIQYGRQDISQEDIDTVVEVLRSDFLTQGPAVHLFEKTVANYCGAEYTTSVSSSTAGLHIACKALDLGPGDVLWTSANTFVASANCALYCGASVDFIDIDPDTYNMSIKCLEDKLEKANKNGSLPKIVMPVHLAGQSCDMAAIYELSKKYGFKIIEDASHAIGGQYKNQPVGNCRFSDVTVFSFHPVKIITTGEGGLVLTNNSELAERLIRLRSHGITSDIKKMESRPEDELWNYQQISLGFNYRMTDIQAALGTSQMKRLDEFVLKRNAIAKRYDNDLTNLPLKTPWQHKDALSSYHLYPILIDLNETKKNHRLIYNELHAAGIAVNLHYIPVYRQPYYESMGFKSGYCPQAEKYHRSAISIPMHPSLSSDAQTYVIETLKLILTDNYDKSI